MWETIVKLITPQEGEVSLLILQLVVIKLLCITLQFAESGKADRRERKEMLPKQILCCFTQLRSGDK